MACIRPCMQEGSVTVSTTNAAGEKATLAKLGEGKFFGERALMRDDPRCGAALPCPAAAPAIPT